MQRFPTKLADVLAAGRLGGLAREAGRRRGETEQIRARLPADEAQHLVSAATNAAGVLVIVMDSAAWAARVRYRAAEWGVERFKIRVSPGALQGR